MAELKTLQDFYDPTRAGVQALSMMQMQQHMAMQQNQQAMQSKNLEVDNARQAYASANPMESYPAAKKYLELSGLPVPDVNTYYANPGMYDNLLKAQPGTPEHTAAMDTWLKTDPRSRAAVEKEVDKLRGFKGAQNLGVKAGLGGDEDTAALIQQSGPLQTQVGNALAQSPLQKAKADLIQQKVDEHERLSANVNRQLSTLVPSTKALGLAIERSTPHVEALAGLQEEYAKNAKALGVTKAGQMRSERIALNQELKEFNDRRQQSIPKLQQALQQVEDQASQLEARAELIARGAAPLGEGESIETLAATVDDASRQRALMKAQLAFAKEPNRANLDALQAIKAQMDETVTTLSNSKTSSQQSLDMHKAGLDERIAEHTRTREYKGKLIKAQIELKKSGSLDAAASIAEKHGVLVDEILPALKDPKQAGIEIKMPGTTEESGKFAMIDNAVKSVQAVRGAITKSDGTIDRGKVFSANMNIPFTEGRNINSMMEDAVSAKLRAETGAAANADEVRSIRSRFDISSLDSDEVINDKLNRLERFLNDTRVIRDSSGKIREVVAQGNQAKKSPQAAAPKPSGTPKVSNESEYNAIPSGSQYIAPDGSTRTKR